MVKHTKCRTMRKYKKCKKCKTKTCKKTIRCCKKHTCIFKKRSRTYSKNMMGG